MFEDDLYCVDIVLLYELEFFFWVCFNVGVSDELLRDEVYDRFVVLEIDLEEVLCLEEMGLSCELVVDFILWCEDIWEVEIVEYIGRLVWKIVVIVIFCVVFKEYNKKRKKD